MNPFVSTQWLADHLGDPEIVVVDASWHLPNAGRDAAAEYRAGHIPGAVRFDIDAVADTTSGLPHMLPDAGTFGAMVGALGIGSDQTIVVYDSVGLFSAPRVWWSLVAMGARDVRILDGGLPVWRDEGRPLETGETVRPPARFAARLNPARVADRDAVLAALGGPTRIVDARPASRFAGEAPEPRPGLRAGHIPGSLNLPFSDLLDGPRLKSRDDLSAALRDAGVSTTEPAITTCGSGVSAAILALAFEIAGAPPARVYDGSWSEWGREDEDTPVETGPR